MKIYEITIKPITGFGTPFKGDTIFGHFCWQIAYDSKLSSIPIDELMASYQEKPFAVFSSMYPKFVVREKYCYTFIKPNLSMDKLFNLSGEKEQIEQRKEIKKKKWMLIEEGQRFSSFKELTFVNDDELLCMANKQLSHEMQHQMRKAISKDFAAQFSQYHNKINRLTNKTGEKGFDPFAMEQSVFYPETELALFVGIEEDMIDIKQIKKGLEQIGLTGFGKDASTGLGRFELGEDSEINTFDMGSASPDACYTLSPCVPEKDTFDAMFFNPFTRFGRHGDVLAKSANPFKNPVIMADEGAIFKPEKGGKERKKMCFDKPYIGTAISDISKHVEFKTVMQGYSLYLPVRVDV
ncbi:MAG: hypothetical protein QME49_04115 [bacterium]|nr:hypothetical protein [bacterium]